MEDFLKTFDKVIGYDDEKRKLMPICDMMRNPEKYAKLGVVMPSGAILQGPPGYGKTLMCKCFIEACGVTYFVCRIKRSDHQARDCAKHWFEFLFSLKAQQTIYRAIEDKKMRISCNTFLREGAQIRAIFWYTRRES